MLLLRTGFTVMALEELDTYFPLVLIWLCLFSPYAAWKNYLMLYLELIT